MHIHRRITGSRSPALRGDASEQAERGRCVSGSRQWRRVGAARPEVALLVARTHLCARIVQLVHAALVVVFLFLGPQLPPMEAYFERSTSVTEVRGDTFRTENNSFRMGVDSCK